MKKNRKIRIPTKRRLIQLYAALLYNANIKGYVTGSIFKGKSKGICVPGFNCYSCPGAIGACPLGSLQNALGNAKKSIPYYVFGIILLYGVIFGRTICGFLCPVGFAQDLLYKLKTPKVKKNKVTYGFSYLKYVFLILLVIAIPLMYGSKNVIVPSFCKYICPVGTFEGAILLLANPANHNLLSGLGPIFTFKFTVLVLVIICSIFIFRFFCRFICPLGAIYSLFNRFSFIGVKVIDEKCIHCGKCLNVCKMDIKHVGDKECINCGECLSVCPTNAITFKGSKVFIDNLAGLDSSNNKDTSNIQSISKKRNIFRISSFIVAIILLITTITYTFIKDSKVDINRENETFIVNTFDDQNIKIDDLKQKPSLLYFYNEIENSYLETLKQYQAYDINILAICSYDIKDSVYDLIKNDDSLVKYAFDDENQTAINSFEVTIDYPSIVILDSNGYVSTSYVKNINFTNVLESIKQLVGGYVVGNKVGNICPLQEIKLYFTDNDETFSILDNRGKITIINFWNTQCGPCVAEMPELNQIALDYQDNVVVIAIHGDIIYSKDVQADINSLWPSRNMLFGQDEGSPSYFEILGGGEAFPWTFVIDQKGIIYKIYYNATSYENLKNDIETILAS